MLPITTGAQRKIINLNEVAFQKCNQIQFEVENWFLCSNVIN